MSIRSESIRRRLGLIVNPIAGIGGRVGLKGSDTREVVQRSVSLGATIVSPQRAVEALKVVRSLDSSIDLVTYPSEMGEYEAEEAEVSCKVLGEISSGYTTAVDTRNAVKDFEDYGVDLILFAGGDGTARDILDSIEHNTPALGIPAGVKMYSAVFGTNPRASAETAVKYLRGELHTYEGEVLDIDEDAFREDRFSIKLYGYLRVPYEPSLIQVGKSVSIDDEVEEGNRLAIARYISEQLEPNIFYILGPGTTVKALSNYLGFEKTLLGVDIISRDKLVKKDVNEREILDIIESKKVKIIVTPIGSQGFIFGRGNLQISPDIIRRVGRDNIIVVATRRKMLGIDTLRVDTGSIEVDEILRGYLRVIIDYREEAVVKCI